MVIFVNIFLPIMGEKTKWANHDRPDCNHAAGCHFGISAELGAGLVAEGGRKCVPQDSVFIMKLGKPCHEAFSISLFLA